MTKKIKKTMFALCIAGLAGTQIFAQTNVSGFISTNTNWTVANAPYIITGNTILDSGIVLTIDPGVTVKFNSAKSLQINGILRAIGNSSNKIIFTSNQVTPAPGDWDYILFADKSTDYNYTLFTGSIMEYCIVEYAGGNSLYVAGAIRISTSFPYIRNCEVRNNYTTGITFDNDQSGVSTIAVIKISNCNIHDNNSLACLNGKGGGIHISTNTSQAIIDSCIISNNEGTSAGGISCSSANNYTSKITNNFIIGNKSPQSIGGMNTYNMTGDVSCNLVYGNLSTGTVTNGGYAAISLGANSFLNQNVFVNNTSINSDVIFVAGYISLTITQNTVVDNTAASSIIYSGGIYTRTINNNTITRNKLTGSSPKSAVYISSPAVFKNNNICRNTADYEVYTDVLQSTPSINVENCWWNTTTATDIDNKIYDFLDNSTLTIVDHNPFATSPDTVAPVSPPINVIKTDLGGGNIKLTWNANQEVDLAGYKIYQGSPTGYSFANFINVGNVNTYTLSGASFTDTIAVTAYDAQMDGVKDQFEGHESWFTNAVGKPIPNFSATPIPVCTSDTVFFTNIPHNLDSYANTTWSWSFPGGQPSISTAKNPKITYSVSGSYSVKLKVTNIAGSDSLTLNNYIVVDTLPNPVITASGSITFCQGNSVTLDAGAGFNTYLWSGNVTTQSIVVNQTGTKNVTVSNNCGSTTTGVSITVNQLPSVSLVFNPVPVCLNQSAYVLSGGLPSGGVYSGAGVSGGIFNPSLAGIGTHTVTYTYSDGNNCSDSATTTIIVEACTGIQYTSGDQPIILFPNPTTGKVEVRFSRIGSIEIFNMFGEKVLQQQTETLNVVKGSNEIDFSNAPKGVYFVKIYNGEDILTEKIVVQ